MRNTLRIINPLTCWIGLAIIQLLLTVLVFQGLPFSGDEAAYAKYGKALTSGDLSVLYGKSFMPGMGLLTALHATVSSFMDIRIFMAVISLLMIGLIIRYAPNIGRSRELFILFLAITPMTLYFSTRIWADLMAGFFGLLIGWLFLKAHRENWPFFAMFIIGGACALILYFRNNLLFLGPALFLAALLIQVGKGGLNLTILKNLVRQGTTLVMGFFLVWSPWVLATSVSLDRLILHPSLIKPHKETSIWAISPPGADWGYARDSQYGKRLFRETEDILVKEGFLDESQRWAEVASFGGRDSWDVGIQGLRLRYTQIQHPDFPESRNAWTYAIEKAQRKILEETKNRTTPLDRIYASARNFSNIFGNPNQFLAAGLKDAKVEFRESTGLFRTKLPFTHGGAVIESAIWPKNTTASLVLILTE